MLMFEANAENPVLIRPIETDEELVDFQVDLLVRRQPEWALETAIRLLGSKPQLVFRLTGLASLDTVDYPDAYSEERGCYRLHAISQALLAAQDALIEAEQIVLSPEHLFFDPETGKARLTVLPLQQMQGSSHLQIAGSDFEDAFLTLLLSLQKAYAINEERITKLKQLANWNSLPDFCAALDNHEIEGKPVQAVKTEASKNTRRPKLLLVGLTVSHLAIALGLLIPMGLKLLAPVIDTIATGSGNLSFLRRLTDLSSPDAHHQLGLLEILRFILRSEFYYPVLAILAALLLVLDLSFAGLFQAGARLCVICWQICCQKIKTSFKGNAAGKPSAKTQANGKMNPVPLHQRQDIDRSGQTVLLAPTHEAYRLGLLSIGLPGTPEEAEGLRAYILVDEFLIGRDETFCDLPLPVPSIGRRHARITRREGSFFITDLGSKNGTNLDGRRLNKLEEYLLPDRCRLEFADQAFYFSAD